MADPTLRVALDARLAARGLGVATYLRGLSAALATHPDVELVWLGPPDEAPAGVEVRSPGPIFPLLESAAGKHLVRRLGVDVVHFAANTGWASPGPVPAAVTLHDLIFLHQRGTTLRQRVGRAHMRRRVPQALRAADAVVAVSAATASEVVAAGWLDRAPRVIHHGVEVFGSRVPTTERHGFVCFSGSDPRKNAGLAIRAYARARNALPDDCELLVLTGAGISAADRALAEQTGGVRLVGYLERRTMQDVVGAALALLHTSTAEGFGLPVIEAMALGTPVVGGLTPSAAELAGDALVAIDPADAEGSLARHLTLLADDPDRRALVATAGLRRAEQFSWERSAEHHLEVYRAAVSAYR